MADEFSPEIDTKNDDRDNDKEMMELEQQLLQQQFELLEQQISEERGSDDAHSNDLTTKENDDRNYVNDNAQEINIQSPEKAPSDTDADFEAIEKQINESLHITEADDSSPNRPTDDSVGPISSVEDQSLLQGSIDDTPSNQVDNKVVDDQLEAEEIAGSVDVVPSNQMDNEACSDHFDIEEAVKSIDEVVKSYEEDDNSLVDGTEGNLLEADTTDKIAVELATSNTITDHRSASDNNDFLANPDIIFEQVVNLKKTILKTDLLDNEEDIRSKQNLWVNILIDAVNEIKALRSKENNR